MLRMSNQELTILFAATESVCKDYQNVNLLFKVHVSQERNNH